MVADKEHEGGFAQHEEKKRCWKTGIEVKIMQKSLWQRTEASPAAPHKGWRDMAEGLRAAGDGT